MSLREQVLSLLAETLMKELAANLKNAEKGGQQKKARRPVATRKDYDAFSRTFNALCDGGARERKQIKARAHAHKVDHVMLAPAVERLVSNVGCPVGCQRVA